ncbi:MAG: hypothetical protein R2790_10985 [Flavobacterium haoranii]
MSTEKVKRLWVKVTYEVDLGDLEIPKDVFDELETAFDECREIKIGDYRFEKASDWLSENIKEKDCLEWECEVEDLIPKYSKD